MALIIILQVLTVGAFIAWYCERFGDDWPRCIALICVLLSLLLMTQLLPSASVNIELLSSVPAQWWLKISYVWIERFGIHFLLGVDGLSYILLMLTLLLGVFAIVCSWREINYRIGFFHCNLLLTLAGIVGVFTALDLFLFFCFWEIMLIPMVLLISIWGHEKRVYAAIKFFIFTQASSLLMLISIVALVLLHFQQSNELTFNYERLINTELSDIKGFWLMLGFFIAFAVKIPVVPWHTWLPDAHTQAPTAGSVILAAILLKTGAYGLIRFTVVLFPQASIDFAPVAMLLAVFGILYGAKLAFAQNDMKRFIAYSSISHMGFVLLGIYAINAVAMQGAVLQMIAHGISTAALFMLAGMIQERYHSRDITVIGGLATTTPKLAAFGLFFCVASLGLPGLANFVAEFFVLLGSFAEHAVFASIAALGLIAAALYSLALLQRAFWGSENVVLSEKTALDLDKRETASLLMLVFALIFFGLRPQVLITNTEPALDFVLRPLLILQENKQDRESASFVEESL